MSALLYLGRSEAEWSQQFDECKAEKLAGIRGERFLSVSTGGKNFTRRIRSRDEIEADLGEALQALMILNPTVWGNATNKTFASFEAYQQK